MEENLKIFKLEYLSNHRWDHPEILNLSLGNQSKLKVAWNEDDLRILKVEYISNHWIYLPQILN